MHAFSHAQKPARAWAWLFCLFRIKTLTQVSRVFCNFSLVNTKKGGLGGAIAGLLVIAVDIGTELYCAVFFDPCSTIHEVHGHRF